MSVKRFLSPALIAVIAALGTGCNDNTVNDSNSTGSIFDNNPEGIDETPWKVPTEGIFYTELTQTSSYAWSTEASNDARPGAGYTDLLDAFSETGTGYGDISYMPKAMSNGDGDQNFGAIQVMEWETSGSGSSEDYYTLARGSDNTVYMTQSDGHEWMRYLPNTKAVGTSWVIEGDDLSDSSYLGTNSFPVGFAYLTGSTVYYRPTISIDSNGNELNSSGVIDTDVADQAITYSSGTSYVGTPVYPSQIRVVEYLKITDDNATAPNGETGCIQISLTYSFRAGMDLQPNASWVGGPASMSGSGTLYWKQDKGIVYQTTTMSVPQIGYDYDSDLNNEWDEETLAEYNMQYDQGLLTTEGSYTWSNWYNGYQLGYSDGYNNVTTNAPDYDLTSESVHSDSQDDGYTQAEKTAYSAGYSTGKTAGAAEAAKTTPAYDATLTANSVPSEYRSINFYGNILDDAPSTGRDYDNGYDGQGETVTPYDSSVTVDPTKIRVAKDEAEQDMDDVYISLPVIGRTWTGTEIISQTANPAGPNASN